MAIVNRYTLPRFALHHPMRAWQAWRFLRRCRRARRPCKRCNGTATDPKWSGYVFRGFCERCGGSGREPL